MTEQIDTSTSALISATKSNSNGNGRIAWPEAPTKKQIFNLPENIIYYMAKNPSSPEVYSKMTQCCKYFFEKKPLLIVKRIHHDKLCSSKNQIECIIKNAKCCANVDLAKLASKIWLIDWYEFNDDLSFNALLPQKIYKCESAKLKGFWQTIVFENFKLIASSFEKFDLDCVEMVDKDRNIVQLEEILGSLPNVKEFIYLSCFENLTATTLTMKKILQLNNLGNLRLFDSDFIPELFDVKDFEDLIMKNKDTKFLLRFSPWISEEYKSQLDGLCATVIKAELFNCVIEYDGQDKEKRDIIRERYDN